MLFGYTCANSDKSDFANGISQIFQANLERSWIEVSKAQELDLEQWEDLLFHIINVFSILVLQVSPILHPCNRSLIVWLLRLLTGHPTESLPLLKIATGEGLFEFMGRLILSPLLLVRRSESTSGKCKFLFMYS
jgi:hypothetical protein